MTQQIQTYSISAPGFYGLNTQDSSLDLAQGFALTANNCVIDKFGRIGARKGWVPQHAYNAALDGAAIRTLGEHVGDDGTTYVMCAGNNKVFRLVGGALTEITYGGGGTAPTITADNWSICHLGGAAFAFQIGHDPLVFDSSLSTTQYRRVSELPGYSGTVQKGNFCMAAFGRIWTVDTATDKSLIQWSDLNAPNKWNSGSAGTLDTTNVWPNGNDTVVGMAAHNNYLFIFGRNNILVYNNANILITGPVSTLAAMSLADTITGIGCIARDSIQYTGSDVLFLSNTGLRSVMRTIQEKSAPFRDLSKNVRTDLMNAVAGEDLAAIKSVYNSYEGFYLLTMPVLKTVYCFDIKSPLPDGASKVTTWDSMEPTSFCMLRDNSMLVGKVAYVGKYTGYLDNTASYRMQYYTNHTDFGAPSVTSILKKLSVVVVGGTSQDVTMKWAYDFTGNFYSQNVRIPSQGESYYGVAVYSKPEGYVTFFAGSSFPDPRLAYPSGAFLTVGLAVYFTSTLALPGGLSPNTPYFVSEVLGTAFFKVSATLGGASINITSLGSGVHTMHITEAETAPAQYSDGIALQTLTSYPTGSGKVVQMGYESNINGSALSIQKIEIQAKNGKII